MAEIVGASIIAGIGFGVFKVICDGVEKITTPNDQRDKEKRENKNEEEINEIVQHSEKEREKQNEEEDNQENDKNIEEIIKKHYEKAQKYVEMNNIEGAEEEFILINEINKKIGEKGIFAGIIKKEIATIRFIKEDYHTSKKYLEEVIEIMKEIMKEENSKEIEIMYIEVINQMIETRIMKEKYEEGKENKEEMKKIYSEIKENKERIEKMKKEEKYKEIMKEKEEENIMGRIQYYIMKEEWEKSEKESKILIERYKEEGKKEEEKRIIKWLNNIYVIEKNKEGIKENFIRNQEIIENEKEEIEMISERAIIEHEIGEYEDSNNSCYECINKIERKKEKKEEENQRNNIEIENQMYYTIIENIKSSNKEKERKEEIEECMNQIIKLTKEIKETMLISNHFIKTLSIEEINSIDQIYRNLICKILIRNVGKSELPNEYTLQMNIKTINGTIIKEGEKIKNKGKKQITMIVTNIENMIKNEIYFYSSRIPRKSNINKCTPTNRFRRYYQGYNYNHYQQNNSHNHFNNNYHNYKYNSTLSNNHNYNKKKKNSIIKPSEEKENNVNEENIKDVNFNKVKNKKTIPLTKTETPKKWIE
ncbi:DNA double-strand break repair Rad50 ATPase, putative [Entamoeba dispar SAW760]|uniref:DNA double-strand break repair Rad50 ATPase, putative n=1 Tax=Entamoeba dispar (strain ATCC PRA-260 / SAW760) TaxID=370354 RepID=B0EFJ1_ENTDS|nr:DNA double-strand break repair Rad50 ATPase, putative [Entamoeba dispar SAW760]EDR26704.1 DNA double-strand break repair Rad50 ATPase, putative [Entamoeba dispar SAW760]|eukprot:EDR26704.1 DNA double-strand break repair Rad50 ATPase, putative [Entamoeba dispar SAW760]